jgi:uncharacterized protein YceK
MQTQGRRPSPLLIALVAASLVGCATATPYVGQGPHPQVTRGRPIPPVDFLGNVFGLLSKLILLNWKADNHAISEGTEASLVRYIDAPRSVVEGTHFALNEYAPGRALKRLVKNRKVAWPYRLLIGLPVTLLLDVLLPGRLFAGLIGGDSYNPYTDTVAIYSDLPSIALHEAGHAHDVSKRRFKGTYATARLIPFVDLYQEFRATDEAIDYLVETGEREEELAAYKVLYPAYGTYVGSYFIIVPGAVLAGALIGHLWGSAKAGSRRRYYERVQAPAVPAAPQPAPAY